MISSIMSLLAVSAGSVELEDGIIALIVIGCAIVVAIAIVVGILSYKSKQKRRLADNAGATNREKRRSNTGRVLEEKEVLQNNVKSVEYLKTLCSENKAIADKMDEVIDKLKYASPSSKEGILAIDKKITNEIEDCKIELSRQKVRDEDVLDIVDEIARLIAERESLI